MIPFVDLRAQYVSIKAEIDEAILGVLDSAQFVLGPEVEAFEALFAPFCGAAYALGVSSGTSALHLALLAAGVRPGDEVITTPHTFVATASAIDYCGARPVFVDIAEDSFTIDPALIEPAMTAKTKVILPVHLYGQPADMAPIMEIAEARGVRVVEDAAQAHGAQYRGRRVGGIGHLGCFSFYPGKNLGAYGEAGAVTTSDADAAKRVRVLRDWGAERRYHHDLKGFNYRLEAIQGAVLRVKMAHIEHWTQARQLIAKRYDDALVPMQIRTPAVLADRTHAYHVYAIRDPDRDELQQFLRERSIGSNIHYPIPVHLQKAFSELGYRRGDFPISERAADEVLSLPMYPELTSTQQDRVIDALDVWATKHPR